MLATLLDLVLETRPVGKQLSEEPNHESPSQRCLKVVVNISPTPSPPPPLTFSKAFSRLLTGQYQGTLPFLLLHVN